MSVLDVAIALLEGVVVTLSCLVIVSLGYTVVLGILLVMS